MTFVEAPNPPPCVIRYSENDGKPPPGVKVGVASREKAQKTRSPLFAVTINFDADGNLFLAPSAGT